ncbi:hypothetical protein D0469_03095 [Peribacillus saganii]|uniref:Uncharacterized protein n=1 Tax=Peribacillus saganii TaxID=2303992 RepID=A0A372LRX8_9BACI|nr:hypothetical protein [Peribacillus saganii]RFU70949.1 hypothetical protein D0469_03095 [Peribacillus saganii]
MYTVEKGSIEEALLHLQNLGLKVNEFQKDNNAVSVDSYKELLDYSISVLREVNNYTAKIKHIFEGNI